MMNTGTNMLWYKQGARSWNEALPIGNGRLGAMVYGGAVNERLSLNEDTLWSGYPTFYENPEAPKYYKIARDLVMHGKNEEAQQIIEQHCEGLWSQVYLALGDMNIAMEHFGKIHSYSRALDISQGVHKVEYECDGVRFLRECFVSKPDDVLVLRFTASRAGAIGFSASLSPALNAKVCLENDRASVKGNCPAYVWHYGDPQDPRGKIVYGESDDKKGMGFYAEMRILNENGSVSRECGALRVKNADSVTILFNCKTSFNGWNRHPVLEGKPFVEPCRKALDEAAAKSCEALKNAHVADHRALYDRVEFDLCGGDEKYLPTDERLYRHEDGLSDNALYALYFNYARYLTIAASREGTQAMNLQGIWNNSVTPPWNCNYTININTEMNYWPAPMVNLSDCCEPLIRLIEELSVSGERAAKAYYGAPGFVSHHNTDIWRLSTPVGANKPGSSIFAFWPMSSGWLMRHLWEHYEYTRDADYLRNRAFPVIRKAAEFYTALLTEDSDGKLILAPSTSPENAYRLDGKQLAVSKTTAMTTAIVRDVLDILLRAAGILGISDGVTEKAQSMLPRLKPLGVGRYGQLLEWDEDFEENDVHHRHMSHMYALHPARFITPEDTPDLAEACRVSLTRRGDESTGWAMGWRICMWARLTDGDHALRLLDNQLRTVEGRREGGARSGEMNYANGGGSYLNLLDAHPPFQIDGNFGACAGIAEMLVKALPDGTVVPLPARPASWTKGSVKGLRTRFGQTVDITWNGDRVETVVR